MSYQTQVTFDENISGFQIALGGALQVVLFFFGGQGPGKTAGG
jgi:hypothetical protein